MELAILTKHALTAATCSLVCPAGACVQLREKQAWLAARIKAGFKPEEGGEDALGGACCSVNCLEGM